MAERDPVRLGEAFDLALALPAQPRLERAGGVVQAGVEDPAVVARLVRRQLRLLLDDGQTEAGPSAEQLMRGGEADDPAADHRDVQPVAGHGRGANGASIGSQSRTVTDGNGTTNRQPQLRTWDI